MTVPEVGTPVATAPAVWGKIPSRNKNFTGRVDILERLRKAAPSKITAVLPEDPLPQALQGLGGVGKTAIAIEYAYRNRGDYDLVWWIPADQLPLVRANLAGLAGPLGLEAVAATGIDAAAQAVLDALRRGDPYDRWLLIFDNADQPEEIMDLIPSGPGDVLITSRNHRWKSVANTVLTDVFTRDESKHFLSKRVPKGLSEADADRLADELGDLPLGLVQAGAMLAETGMAVDEYLRLLRERVTSIMKEGKSPDYPMSMTAAWMLSATTLEEQLPQARELLRCCAFFGPEPIPTDLFRQGAAAAGARTAGLFADPILLSRAVRELGRFALVTVDGRSVVMHRLIQALIRDGLTEEEQEYYRHEVHLILAEAAPKNTAEERLWTRFRELVAHVVSEATQVAQCQDPGVREFALNMMRFLYVSGDLTSSRSLAERFIEQWSLDSGPDDPYVLDARRHLGNALRWLGRYRQSYELTESALADARRVLGDRATLTLWLRTSFSADLRARGDFPAARELDAETRGLLEDERGPKDPQTLRVLASLALDYGLNSDYRASRDLYSESLRLMNEQSANVSAGDMLGTWTGLAWAVRMGGNYAEARDVSEDAWAFGRERLGVEHPATLRTANVMAIAMRRTTSVREDPVQREEALQTARETFEMSGALLGEAHPETMSTAINLSNLERTIGHLDEAMALADRTVDRYPRVYGPEHPYNYGCIGNLAILRRATGAVEAAHRLNTEALAGLDTRLTRNHHYSLTVAINLASDLVALGRPAEALVLGQDTLERLRRLLGNDHPTTLACAANLSLDLKVTGDEQAGDALAADTMDRYVATLGPDHPDTQAAAAERRLDPDFDPPSI
jgi:tetratricopeptide (TPR) repeat protein